MPSSRSGPGKAGRYKSSRARAPCCTPRRTACWRPRRYRRVRRREPVPEPPVPVVPAVPRVPTRRGRPSCHPRRPPPPPAVPVVPAAPVVPPRPADPVVPAYPLVPADPWCRRPPRAAVPVVPPTAPPVRSLLFANTIVPAWSGSSLCGVQVIMLPATQYAYFAVERRREQVARRRVVHRSSADRGQRRSRPGAGPWPCTCTRRRRGRCAIDRG